MSLSIVKRKILLLVVTFLIGTVLLLGASMQQVNAMYGAASIGYLNGLSALRTLNKVRDAQAVINVQAMRLVMSDVQPPVQTYKEVEQAQAAVERGLAALTSLAVDDKGMSLLEASWAAYRSYRIALNDVMALVRARRVEDAREALRRSATLEESFDKALDAHRAYFVELANKGRVGALSKQTSAAALLFVIAGLTLAVVLWLCVSIARDLIRLQEERMHLGRKC
jgi:methyl-accepting chemotaxis protein